MDELTTSSVDGLLEKIRLLASRPISEFNRFEALNMLEALKNAAQDAKHEKAGYYKYTFETLREKVALPNDQFRNFLLPLWGDKDQERVLDVIAKVEKNNRRNPVRQDFRAAGRAVSAPYYRPLRCYYCNRLGHVKLHCLQRKREMGALGVSRGPPQQSHNTNRDK